MPRVALPDGQSVDFPDGMSGEQMSAAVQQYLASRAPAPERSIGQQIMRGVAMPAAGFNESVATTVGAIPDLINAGMRGIGLPATEPGQYTDWARQGMQFVTGKPPAPETMSEHLLYGAGKGIGDAASVLIPATAVAQGARAGSVTHGVAQALAAQPATQAVSGAVGGAVGDATGNPYVGMAAGMATPFAMQGLARLAQPVRPQATPGRQALIDELDQAGVPLSAAERTGSRALGYLEGAFDILPGSSAGQQAIHARQAEALNRASLAHSGTVADAATPDVINAARTRIGNVIGTIAGRNNLVIQPEVIDNLARIQDGLRFVPAEAAGPVRARLDQLQGMVVNGADHLPYIPGASYRQMDSAIGRTIRGTTNGDLRTALGDLRETLRTAMDASISPADQAAWQQARRQYANLMVTARAASGAGAGAAEGNVSPLALRGAVDQSTGRGYAFGQGDQNLLARAGQAILRKPPDSGTAGRTFYQHLLTGGIGGGALAGGASPMSAALIAGTSMVAPRVAHAVYNTAPVQHYLTHGIPGLNQIAAQAPQMNRALATALLAEQGKNAMVGR